jgi:uncharacterized protein (TIGR00106 family)
MLLEFSIHPLGKGVSLSPLVARAVDIVDRSGIDYRLTPLGTVLEGDWEPLMKVVRDCRDEVLKDCDRVTLRITIDDRKGKTGRLQGNLAAVERALGRKVRT